MPLQSPLQLSWRCSLDVPHGVKGYVQSAVVQGSVYIGGGQNAGRHDSIVMEYNISSEKWVEIPRYVASYFGMTVISNHLVLVGGWERSQGPTKALGVWRDDIKEWTHSYPDMHTARSKCSLLVYKEWLIVAGGLSGANEISSVEVMNTESKQWHTGQSTPVPWYNMRAAIVDDMCYFMGGDTSATVCYGTRSVYSISLSALISQTHSHAPSRLIWKEMTGPGTTLSCPLSISGSLFAVGGRDPVKCNAVSAICLYQPDNGEWVKVGDLPTPRQECTCAISMDRELLVASGCPGSSITCTLEFAHIIETP